MSRKSSKNNKGLVSWIIIIVLAIAVTAALFMLNSQDDDAPDLSMLNIDVFLKSIGTGDGLVAETEDDGFLFLIPEEELLELFNQNEWKIRKVNSPYESSSTLRLHINDGYNLSFYFDEDYAMVFFRDSQEKYRYYDIPDGTYERLEEYIIENGQPWGDVIPHISSEDSTDGPQGIEIAGFQVKAMVDNNLEVIMSSPLESSNP